MANETELNEGIINYHVRCQCTYCEHCTYEVSIYDICEFCYEGKHPSLSSMGRNFEKHLEKIHQLWPETIREENIIIIKPSKFSIFKQLLRTIFHSNGSGGETK